MPFEFPGAVQPAEIDPAKSHEAFAVMSSQVRGVIEAADELQDRIATAEAEMIRGRRRDALGDLRLVSRQLSALMGVTRGQRRAMHDARQELERVRDGHQHLADLEQAVDKAADRIERARRTATEALNLYQSIAAEQLTRIATLLLPLTVVSGFFGMNFGWMVEHIDSAAAFFAFGIGGVVAALGAGWVYLRRTGA